MSVARYRNAARWLRWPGTDELVPCRLLPLAAVEAAELAGRELYLAAVGDEGGAFGLQRRHAEVLARALEVDVQELLEGCVPAELEAAYASWERLQDAAMPDAHALRERLSRGVLRDDVRYFDGLAAWLANPAEPDPQAYFGRPTLELTAGELEYFTLLRAAWQEHHIEGKHKNVSREWLERED